MIVYLAGPMTPKNGFSAHDNAAQGVEAWLALARAGVPCFCPQMSCYMPNFDAINTDGYDLWLRFDFACIDAATHVLMLPRWETSMGACREYEHATKTGKKIRFNVADLVAEAEALRQSEKTRNS